MRVGIIGATGWLGSALGQHLLSGRVVPAEALVLLNRSGPRADYHGHRPHWAADVAELVALADVIVVSVRPEDWHGLALQAPGKLVLSFMAGVGADLLAASGGRIVRAMPNAAAESGHSYSPFWAAPGVTPEDREAVRRILGAIGTTDELPAEAQIDLMTALPGSGAAYPALMAMAMADFMTGHGVPETVAWRAVELVAAYRDYRGTTAAGIEAAEAAGFPQAVARALEAATEKARRLVAAAPT